MKNFKLLFILALLLIAAVIQWQRVRNRAQETDLRQELASLKQETPHTTTDNTSASRLKGSSRPEGESAQSNNRNTSGKPLDELDRLTLAIENGDLAEATRNYCLIKYDAQNLALNQLWEAVTTQEDQRLVLEQAAKSADQATFLNLSKIFAQKSTFEANIDMLTRAELTPEKYDIAAAAIAGIRIDDQTPDRAAWLLKSLKTDQTEPITHFAQTWTEYNSKAATTWVSTLPLGRTRDAAVAGFAPIATRIDGASAVDWALTITDLAQRKSTLDIVTRIWIDREPEAAAAYLLEKGLEAK